MKRIKDWEELTIQDNFLFLKVMQNKRLCQHLIEKILQIKIVEITYPDTEKSIDVRWDSRAYDSTCTSKTKRAGSTTSKCSAKTKRTTAWPNGRGIIRE